MSRLAKIPAVSIAETRRKTRSKPEATEVAEDAEGYRPGVSASQCLGSRESSRFAQIVRVSSAETRRKTRSKPEGTKVTEATKG